MKLMHFVHCINFNRKTGIMTLPLTQGINLRKSAFSEVYAYLLTHFFKLHILKPYQVNDIISALAERGLL